MSPTCCKNSIPVHEWHASPYCVGCATVQLSSSWKLWAWVYSHLTMQPQWGTGCSCSWAHQGLGWEHSTRLWVEAAVCDSALPQYIAPTESEVPKRKGPAGACCRCLTNEFPGTNPKGWVRRISMWGSKDLSQSIAYIPHQSKGRTSS